METKEIKHYLQNLFVQLDFEACKIPFHEYMLQWLESVKSELAASTYTGYRQCVNIICEYFLQKHITMDCLSPKDIQQFYDYEISLGKSAATVLHYHANIHKALKSAVKRGMIFSNPSDYVDLPKKERFFANFYSADEVKLLLKASQHEDIRVCVYIAAYYGLRRSEIIGLKWSAIDFKKKTIAINNKIVEIIGEDGHYHLEESKTLKNSASCRVFPLVPAVERVLRNEHARQTINSCVIRDYHNEFDSYICRTTNGNLITPNYFSSHFCKLLQKYGLRRIRLHDLRHTCASMLLSEGASMKQVQDWLGHSDYGTTANTYCHLDYLSKRETAEFISAAFE